MGIGFSNVGFEFVLYLLCFALLTSCMAVVSNRDQQRQTLPQQTTSEI